MTRHPICLMPRLSNWPERLDALTRQHAATPFAWGTHDCCTFAADAVQAITGHDPMEPLRHSYQTALQATAVLKARGGLREAVTQLLGRPADPALVTVGDVLLVMNEGRELLAVCNGTTCLAPGADGLAVLAGAPVLAAWRVA